MMHNKSNKVQYRLRPNAVRDSGNYVRGISVIDVNQTIKISFVL